MVDVGETERGKEQTEAGVDGVATDQSQPAWPGGWLGLWRAVSYRGEPCGSSWLNTAYGEE